MLELTTVMALARQSRSVGSLGSNSWTRVLEASARWRVDLVRPPWQPRLAMSFPPNNAACSVWPCLLWLCCFAEPKMLGGCSSWYVYPHHASRTHLFCRHSKSTIKIARFLSVRASTSSDCATCCTAVLRRPYPRVCW